MWGVRRRDAARHSESGWLIRPEMRSSSSFRLGLINLVPLSRPADPSGPVRAHFWAMALVMHLMTLFIAPA